MNDNFSNEIKAEIDKINIPEERLEKTIQVAIHKGIKKQRKPIYKKTLYLCSAAVLLFSLFIGSTFVSPVMADVMSKLPFIGSYFGSNNDVMKMITEELHEKGYKVNASTSYPEKEILIEVSGSETHYREVKSDIETISNNILKARNYDAYMVKVVRGKTKNIKKNDDVQKKSGEYQLLDKEIRKELEKSGINILHTSIHYNPQKLVLDIPNTESRVKQIKEKVNNIISSNNIESMQVEVRKVDLKKSEQESRWGFILQDVKNDLLGKKEYKISQVGFTIEPQPTIQVFLSLPSSDEDVKEFAENIEIVINEYLNSDNMESVLMNDSYSIIIHSKDNIKLN